MDWLTAPFELGFQQRALLGGSLAAVATSVVGTWVVLRGMTFLGDALVHGVIPGIALALLLGFSPLLGAVAADLSDTLRRAMESLVVRDEMGPHVGDVPPDFNLKRMGSNERVRLSGFKDQRPVALIFGSYT